MRAFTLIEMLVLLALLAVLAALLFPTFAQAREKGRQATCAGNLRQLLLALALYSDDYDDRLPEAGDIDERTPAGWVFAWQPFYILVEHGSLFGYTRNSQIYLCPSRRRLGGTATLSYTFNHAMSWRTRDSAAWPARTLLLVEEADDSMSGRGPNDGVLFADHPTDRLATRHAEGGNAGWLDGHVSWQRDFSRGDGSGFFPDRQGE